MSLEQGQKAKNKKSTSTKSRQHRGISVGIPIPKDIPVGIAKMKASIDLDKRDSMRQSIMEAIKNFKPDYPLLFDKNLKGIFFYNQKYFDHF